LNRTAVISVTRKDHRTADATHWRQLPCRGPDPGATVEEAELELENGMATFEEVELAG
jgi:hypothetical protein